MTLTLPQLARRTLENYLKGKDFRLDEKTKKKYSDKKACFVTLTKKGELRGCIGNLEARQKLWKEVQEQIINSAFNDFRFEPLKKEELKEIKIEISVLNESKKLKFVDEEDLLNKIDSKMGLIIKKGYSTATFLPQVWKQNPNKKKFLEQLCLKAGINKNCWKEKDIELYYYSVNKEEEE